ncbi:MAG: hypothetical protein KUG74_04770 [Rhodobacteraceae bacterium]|nr:hypothetical protein [Paracoccaceae bacterium]
MYRRVSSSRFIAFATIGIVIVMAVFTWVMYGMAQRVFVMTDIMVELNQSIKSMVGTQESMTADIHAMALKFDTMNTSMVKMNKNVGDMNTSIAGMSHNIETMSKTMQVMTVSVNRMTRDIGQASYAFSQPMSYMWGNPFPF